jgi:hypothetical protein
MTLPPTDDLRAEFNTRLGWKVWEVRLTNAGYVVVWEHWEPDAE